MKNRIRIARTNNLSTLTGDDLTLPLKEGQPFYDKKTNKLYIGQDDNSTLGKCKDNTIKPINATNADNVTGTIDGHDIKGTNGIFENDGTTVKLATLAQYASSDISKGTIEERLTSLGFKQGNIWDANGTNVVGQLYRQGNYIIGKQYDTHHVTPSAGGLLFWLSESDNYNFLPKLYIESVTSDNIPRSPEKYDLFYGGGTASTFDVVEFDTIRMGIFLYGDHPQSGTYAFNFGYEAFPIATLKIEINSNQFIITSDVPPQYWESPQSLNVLLNNLEIHYTVDGSAVTSSSLLYTGPTTLPSGVSTIKCALYEKYYGAAVDGTYNILKYRQVSKEFSKQISHFSNI